MKWIRCREGVADAERIPVTSDALDIVRRIKELDERYFVMLNRKTQKYEVHVAGQRCTLGCELPFEALDARAVTYVREHDSSRLDEIVREMEREDEAREKASKARMGELAGDMADYVMWDNNRS